jgi:hypothetical protein
MVVELAVLKAATGIRMMSDCCEDGVASESAEGEDSEEAIIGTVITLSVSLLEELIARNTSLGDGR